MAEPAAPAAVAGRSGLGARAIWIVADQAVSSLANAGLTFVIAGVVSPSEYGAFALAFSVYSLVIALTQGLCGQVLVIRYSAADPARQTWAAAAAGGAAVLLGALSGLITLVIALFTGMPLRGVLLAVAVLLPALALQDTWRTAFVSRGSPRAAFVNDLVWTLLQAVGVGVLLLLGADQAVPFVLAWAGSALVAALFGARQNRQAPTYRTTRGWVVDHRDVSYPSLTNAVVNLGTIQIAFVVIAVIGAVDDVGALRAAQTLLGPLNIVGFAVGSFVIPEVVRRSPSKKGLVQIALAVSGLLVAVDALWGGVLLLIPESVGVALLGETWTSAREALPAMIAFTCLTGASVGATAIMRALNRVSYNVWINALLGPLILVLSAVGVRMAGASGAAAGFMFAGLLVLPPCWWFLARAVSLGRREVATP